MKIGVIGTGYVGLVTGSCLAEAGHEVVCIDKDPHKVATLQAGGIPIFEPGLESLVRHNHAAGRLTFSTELSQALQGSAMVFLCVGTPQLANGDADLKAIWEAVESMVAHFHRRGSTPALPLLVIKSTVPVGTNGRLAKWLDQRMGRHVEVASNPEFLREGAAVADFREPDRVVIGVRSGRAEELLRELYEPFTDAKRPLLVMSPESAEMTKYVANALLATKISFINEVANLCEALDADIDQVRQGMGYDARIGFQFFAPGPGWGGSCFPKDIQAYLAMARNASVPAEVVGAVYRANEHQKRQLVRKIEEHYGERLSNLTLAVWGLAFKPGTDDIRESPALTLIDDLLQRGVRLQVRDPKAEQNVRREYQDRLVYCSSPLAALQGAHGLVIVTEWSEFRNPDFRQMRQLMTEHVIFDGRNLLRPDEVRTHGFVYHGLGRPSERDAANLGRPPVRFNRTAWDRAQRA